VCAAQAVAFFMTPRAYIRLACLTFLTSVLVAYWAVFIPWVSRLPGRLPPSMLPGRSTPESMPPKCFPAALQNQQGVHKECERPGRCRSRRAVDPNVPAMAVICL